MLAEELRARGIEDEKVLAAMTAVPRHEFVPPALAEEAYADRALPIGEGQTISQPYVVALMTELLRLRGGEKVLEVGTGSGYQAAVLAELGCTVYSIEIIPRLATEARSRLGRMGYERVHVREGDGRAGWPSVAPFDAIIVTAAAPEVPPALLDQLREGGRLVMPLGGPNEYQELVEIRRTAAGIRRRYVTTVRFVPLVGKAERD